MLHPGKYVSGLKKAVLRQGVELYENSPVERVRDEGGSVEVSTASGRVSASKLVLGLNAYLPASRLGVVRDRAVTLFSFIILTEPLNEQHWKEIGWRGRQGYSDKRSCSQLRSPHGETDSVRRARAVPLRPAVGPLIADAISDGPRRLCLPRSRRCDSPPTGRALPPVPRAR